MGTGGLGLIPAHDEAAPDRVVVFLAQHALAGAERGEPHAVGMARQPLVHHEEELHRLVEGDLVLAEQADAPAAADALHGRVDAVRVDAFRLRTLEPRQDRPVGARAPCR